MNSTQQKWFMNIVLGLLVAAGGAFALWVYEAASQPIEPPRQACRGWSGHGECDE